jgi:hypothetical protein
LPCHREASAAPRHERPRFEVADVFRAHGETYRQSRALSGDQLKAMRAIEACRTEALGGHLDVCPDCGFKRPSYNSCRNRHCPKCQSLAQARWIEQRIERVLPVHHFHVVFSLPSELRSLARYNRKRLFALLFAAASQTLLELGNDPRRLGARLGITAVLHTWTRELLFHPHLHCIVTGGGLAPSGETWLPLSRRYLVPVKVMGALFRGKFLAGLRQLYDDGQLHLGGRASRLSEPTAFAELINKLYRTNWVVYAKRPFAGTQQVFRYLGRYTHRVAISNQRIQSIDKSGVRFATKGGRSVTVPHQVFIARFLSHILPAGFTKMRHFGLYASGNVNTKLEQARALTAPAASAPSSDDASPVQPWNELVLMLTGTDPMLCPNCGARLVRVPRPWWPARRPPPPRDTS